jgi:hypothetical protein
MRSKYCYLSIIPLLFFDAMLFSATAAADIYIYKDKGGHMVITDSPPDNVEEMEIIKDKSGTSSRSAGFRDIEMDLTVKYRPKSDTEKASLGTVTVKTSVRRGSGSKLRGVKADLPAPKEQTVVLRQTAANPPVIIQANSTAYKYSDEVIQVPADIEGR